ncbi:hypothetical protein F5Y06DRAFT_257626 [Hypoxylon sp. FL0890]|nr:hypothetical protein F5Y06DRAFT_257626 [Hypoxylon sp. FL0890]
MVPNPTRLNRHLDEEAPQQPTTPMEQFNRHPSEASDTDTIVGQSASIELPNGPPNGLPNSSPDSVPDDINSGIRNGLPSGLPGRLHNSHIPPGQSPMQVYHVPVPIDAFVYEYLDYAKALQALEAVRESPDALGDPWIKGILERALREVWRRITTDPDQYIMSRDEFAVFNFFQHLYKDDIRLRLACKARANYWDNTYGPRIL